MFKRLINRFKMDKSLTPASFDKLLAFLGPDRESASQAYLDIRRALFIFFVARGAANPGEMADETINRLAGRLGEGAQGEGAQGEGAQGEGAQGEGAQITTENPSSFIYAVALNVWRESLANPNTLISLSEVEPAAPTQATPHDLMISSRERIVSEARNECLDKCLDQLDSEERELIVSYYRFGDGEKIEYRKKLAASLGLSGDALRQQVARLRSRLAECVNDCQKSRSRLDLK